jgi:hypothetical protein
MMLRIKSCEIHESHIAILELYYQLLIVFNNKEASCTKNSQSITTSI